MRSLALRRSVLYRTTLVILAATCVSGLTRAQQASQPEGAAMDGTALPLIDLGSFVMWTYGSFGNQSEILFGRLDHASFSVVTQRPLNSPVSPWSRAPAGASVDDVFPQIWHETLPIPSPPSRRDRLPFGLDGTETLSINLIGLPPNSVRFSTDELTQIFATSYGFFPDTNPPFGSGRWQGHVLGIDIGQGETHGNQVLGDASIVLTDSMGPHVDIQLSGLLDVVTESARPDIQWRDIPVDQGAFAVEDGGSGLYGRFFGPAHVEIEGSFATESILGAFGATRTDDTALSDQGGNVPVLVGLWFGSATVPASLGIGFDAALRFRRGGASTSRVGLDYSVWKDSSTLRGEAGLSTVWHADSHSHVYSNGSRLEERFVPQSTIGPFYRWSDQRRVFSGGLATSVNPHRGGATWVGEVSAFDPMDPSITVTGDALVQIDDFNAPDAFVALTNLREDVTRRPRHDIYWNRIPVTRGAFDSKTAGGWIRGRFHGQDQDEVAGTFFRPSLTGAFGASRAAESTSRAELDASIPIDPQAGTALHVLGRVSGSAVPIVSSGRSLTVFTGRSFSGEVGKLAFQIAEEAYEVAALGTSLPMLEWVAGTREKLARWLGTLLGDPWLQFRPSPESNGVEELLNGEASYTLRPLPNGNFGVLRYDAAGSGDMSLAVTAGFAFGGAEFTNPLSGAATWTGEVLGFDSTDGDTSGNQVAGIATLTIGDFAAPMVDVAFTGMQEMRTRAAVADMTWSAMPLEDGGFRSEELSGVIEGQMYGTGHSHVGGVFERGGIFGGFGARRESEP